MMSRLEVAANIAQQIDAFEKDYGLTRETAHQMINEHRAGAPHRPLYGVEPW